jgi:MFS family permease
VLNVIDGALFAFALSVVSRATVLPVFVQRIGGENTAIALIPVLWFAGFNLPQLFVANLAERASPKKPLLLITGLGQRLPWLLIALLTLFVLADVSVGVALALSLGTLLLAAVGGSINLPVWFELISKITPVRLRGRLFGLRVLLGAALGIFGGWIAEVTLASNQGLNGFAYLFGMAFALMMLSYIVLVLLREQNGDVTDSVVPPQRILVRLGSVIRTERNFRNYLVAQTLLILATLAEAFIAVDAMGALSLDESYAGRFTIVLMSGIMAGSVIFGFLADRFGHRVNLIASALSMAAAGFSALAATEIWHYHLAFVGVAFAVALQNISRLTIVAELCGERDRPTYVAIANVVTAPFLVVGLGLGWMADTLGYESVFLLSSLLALLSAGWFTIAVREPRVRT